MGKRNVKFILAIVHDLQLNAVCKHLLKSYRAFRSRSFNCVFFGLCFSEFAVLVVKIETLAEVEDNSVFGFREGASMSVSV